MASYKRVPMVRDLEYFAAFLRSVKDGGRKQAEQEIRRLLLQFESEKDKAVGKGKKLKLRLKSLLAECERLSYETGIIEKSATRYKANTEDPDVALLLEGNPSDQRFRASLLRRLFATYRSFIDLIFRIRGAPEGKVYASHDRTGENFQQSIKRYNLDMTQWTFEASRDLATQLDLINWRMLDPEEISKDAVLGKSGYLLYLTSTVCRISELQMPAPSVVSLSEFAAESIKECRENLQELLVQGVEIISQGVRERGYLFIEIPSDPILIRHNAVAEKKFEEAVWHEYLKMTDRVPREPVYYCQLRDRVCEALRIQDHVFDRIIDKMITQPGLFSVKVSPGEGSLPMRQTVSRKHIPPKLFSDSYMVYLRMEKPKSV